MENLESKQKVIKKFLQASKVASANLQTNTGYVSLVFSPSASESREKTDKLGVVLTFEEWQAIATLLKAESEIPWSTFCNNRFISFLLEAIDSIPSTVRESKPASERESGVEHQKLVERYSHFIRDSFQ